MTDTEIFNTDRIDRCFDLFELITEHWRRTNAFAGIFRLCDSFTTGTLDELRTKYFTIGIPGNTRDVPFLDLLVVLDLIRQYTANVTNRQQNASQFQMPMTANTQWPDEDAVLLLQQFRVESHIPGKYLRFEAHENPQKPDFPS